MKNLVLIAISFALLSFASCINLASSLLSDKININYEDLSASYSNVQIIYDKYASFKEKVKKNTTLQYNACVESIKTLKCNNIDQWASVIAELKLEIENSEQIEIPFLKQQKQNKINQYRDVLSSIQSEEYNHQYEIEEIKQFQKGVENSTQQIKIMYKLPEEVSLESEFVQKSNQQVEPAQESIQKAKDQYEIADISIQAQTATNVMTSLAGKIPELEQALNEQYSTQMKLLTEKKTRIKQEILQLRGLLQNEKLIQQKNTQKINELNTKISQCESKPTNIEKDCGPILVIAEKLYTEIDIVNTRTNVLIKELNNLLQANGQVGNEKYEQEMENMEKSKQFQKEWDFADQQEDELYEQGEKQTPVEQVPVHQQQQEEKILKKQEQKEEIKQKQEGKLKQEEGKQQEVQQQQENPQEIQNQEQEVPQETQNQEQEQEAPQETQNEEQEAPQETQNQEQPQTEQAQETQEAPQQEPQQETQQEEQQQQAEQDQQVTEETQPSDTMVFAYKTNPEYQGIDNNNEQQLDKQNVLASLDDEDENSLNKLLEKEFADEDNEENESEESDSDTYADQFDYNNED